MDKVLLGILIVICGVIFWQDVRQRAVHWVMFPLLFLSSLAMKIGSISLENWLFNALILILLMGTLTLYLTLKNGKLINITRGFFSWGDILFLIAVLPLFETFSFVLYFTIGTLLSLVFHVSTYFIRPQRTIPYAGYMGLVTIGYIFIEPTIIQLITPHV